VVLYEVAVGKLRFEKGLGKRGWRFCCEAEAEYHEFVLEVISTGQLLV
jgi:hypothetical protein